MKITLKIGRQRTPQTQVPRPRTMLCWCALATLPLLFLARSGFAAQPKVVYTTGFETAEGYDPALELTGQDGWISVGMGGNGLIDERFAGRGLQGYVGFNPPLNSGELSFSTWRPVNYDPIAEGAPIVKFQVAMEIADSTDIANRDDFRWSVYNSAGFRLFTLGFNNATAEVCYALDDEQGFQATPYGFLRDTIYNLEILMDFEKNTWSATLDSTVVVESQSITTTGATLDLGDVDAVWYYLNPDAIGDNFMAFDDYLITAESPSPVRPTVMPLHLEPDGQILVRLAGQPDVDYIIEASDDLVAWTPIKTARSSDGVIDHYDTAAIGKKARFYRGRLTP